MLETELRRNSGNADLCEVAEPWGEKIMVSGRHSNLITGQNPQSAGAVGDAVLKAVLACEQGRKTT